MPLSRNIYAKSILSNDLRRRYRSTNQPKRVSDKQVILENLSRDKYITPNRGNKSNEKEEILRNFDPKKIDELRKRQKFSPYDGGSSIVVDQPTNDICLLFDSDFSADCDYYSGLYILGSYVIFENFETRTTEDTGGEIFNVSPFKYIEDFETSSANDDVYDMSSPPPI
jgi:hypothetical protein